MIALLAAVALAATPRASSELKDKEGVRHSASKAVDGLLQTGWAEGAEGNGEGSWLELRLDKTTDVQSVSIWPGNLSKGVRSLRENGRPHTVTVTLKGGGEEVSQEVRILDGAEDGIERVDVAIEGKAKAIRIHLDKVYRGGLRNDAYIAEVAVNFVKGYDVPSAVGKLQEWLKGDSGQKALAKDKEEIVELFQKIQETEFGDRDSLRAIMDRAGDGAPFLRKRVVSSVPAGYRVHALPPDGAAIDALLKIKDANAIPAIERAALRSRGKAQEKLQERVEVFYAYQELVGGPNLNVPPWGEEGFGKGAFRTFGEPLPIEVDQAGRVFVADVANHRVQRLNDRGIAEAVYGTEPEITNVWFGKGRTWYAAGSKPDDKEGSFHQPVDLAVVPGKLDDTIYVLDHAGRVQRIDPDDSVTEVYEVPVDGSLGDGVGGEGFLLHAKGKLVTIWGNRAYVHDLDGNALNDFELSDGVPSGAEALKNGKLLLIFDKELVLWHTTGFRDGDVLAGTAGEGFEYWDVTVDEKGKLWVVTDTGWALKYKKPGKVDFKIKISDVHLEVPRVAARDGVLYVTDRNRILRLDALELNAKAELAAEEGGDELPEADL